MLHPTSRFKVYRLPPTYLSRTLTNAPKVPTTAMPTLLAKMHLPVATLARVTPATRVTATNAQTSTNVPQRTEVALISVLTQMVALSAHAELVTPSRMITPVALQFTPGQNNLSLRPRPPIPSRPSSPPDLPTRLPPTALMLRPLSSKMPLPTMPRPRPRPLPSPRSMSRPLPTRLPRRRRSMMLPPVPTPMMPLLPRGTASRSRLRLPTTRPPQS